MANIRWIRHSVYGLLTVLYLSVLSAQDTSKPVGSTSQDVSQPSLSALVAPPAEVPPPKAPIVICTGGRLAVSADDSTLRSVLAAIHACIGVQIDLPDSSDGGRIFEMLGPGPVRQVLTSLLSGTDFNYVIGWSDTNPEKAETVLLTRRTKIDAPNSSSTGYMQTPARRAWAQMRQNNRSAQGDEDHPVAEEPAIVPESGSASAPLINGSSGMATSPTDTATPPTTSSATDTVPAGDSVSATSPADAPVSAGTGADSGKATEDRITDMQKLFEQRRKMTQPSTPATPQQ